MAERSVLVALGALGVVLGAASGCDSNRPARGPAPAQNPAGQVVRPPAPPVVPPGRGAQVFVDVSQSIQGFTGLGSVALEALHAQVIEASLSAQQLNNPFQRCRVDDAVHCEAPFVTAQQLRLPTTYRGANAALHLALRRPPRAPRPDMQQPDPLDPWAVTVMVTDGFQSTGSMFQPGASSDVACTSGADPSCLAALLRQRVDEGYGVWVGRVILGFDGRYYAERRLDATMWARVQAHVRELNVDPAWNGVRFAATAPNLTSNSGAFRWSGARPMLVFVLSRDIPRGRALVADMQRRLMVERITRRAIPEDVRFAEWAPFDGLSAMATSAVRAQSGGQNDNVLVDRVQRTPQGLLIPARCTVEGKAAIRVDGAVQYGLVPPPPFARIAMGWQLLARPPRSTASELLVPREPMRPVPGPFVVHTGIDCTVIPAGTYRYEMGLAAQWTVDPAALAQEWYSRESAETSYEMPERVFGLADLARAVVTAGVQRAGVLDRVILQVQRN